MVHTYIMICCGAYVYHDLPVIHLDLRSGKLVLAFPPALSHMAEDAETLIFKLHGQLLRILSAKVVLPFLGLAAAKEALLQKKTASSIQRCIAGSVSSTYLPTGCAISQLHRATT